MRPQEVALLKETVDLEENDDKTAGRQAMVQTVRSHRPVSIVRKDKEVDSYLLTNLVDNYAHLNIEDSSGTPQGSQRAQFQHFGTAG